MEKKYFEDANRCDLESGHVVFLRAQRRTVHWRFFSVLAVLMETVTVKVAMATVIYCVTCSVVFGGI